MTVPIEEIRVRHRTGQWCPGVRTGRVAAYDVRILPGYQVAGRPTIDRSYLLLDQGIQLTRPVVFEGPVEGWWYVDIVDIEHTDAGLIVHDLYVDFLVPPDATRYHVLDLNDLAKALTHGDITPAQCAAVLTTTQQFINHHLRADPTSVDAPTHFPPPAITPLEPLPSFYNEPA
ncbi:DUF402 domain-containing protein [Kribbella sp. NPDC026611]|uniref:DUF402 domain-containing protein n=1 Tax=Kribbella sp. NPDC026611 TaxID=3154911 RepID=UPI00341063BE